MIGFTKLPSGRWRCNHCGGSSWTRETPGDEFPGETLITCADCPDNSVYGYVPPAAEAPCTSD